MHKKCTECQQGFMYSPAKGQMWYCDLCGAIEEATQKQKKEAKEITQLKKQLNLD